MSDKLISTNPAKGYTVIGEVDISTTHDIESAVAAAHKAKAGWQALGLDGRITVLRKLVTVFEKHRQEIALLPT